MKSVKDIVEGGVCWGGVEVVSLKSRCMSSAHVFRNELQSVEGEHLKLVFVKKRVCVGAVCVELVPLKPRPVSKCRLHVEINGRLQKVRT